MTISYFENHETLSYTKLHILRKLRFETSSLSFISIVNIEEKRNRILNLTLPR